MAKRTPKLSEEAYKDLEADVVNGSLWERKDGRVVIVHDCGLAGNSVRIKTVGEIPKDGKRTTRQTLRTAWVHINRYHLVREYTRYQKKPE
jgi:hypothetical protein